MRIALIILLILVLANLALTWIAFVVISEQLAKLKLLVSAAKSRAMPDTVGGRLAPTGEELQAARNRMDRLGVAHPGGPG